MPDHEELGSQDAQTVAEEINNREVIISQVSINLEDESAKSAHLINHFVSIGLNSSA